MTARHAHRPGVPFWVAVVALVVLIGSVSVAASRGGSEPPAGGAEPVAASASGPAGAVGATSVHTPTPPPSPTPEPRGKLVIHGTGDVSLDPTYIPAFLTNGYGWAWSGLGGLFRRDELTVINHECPSTDIVAPITKEFVFRCDPRALDEAHAAGVDVANLSNNHALDQAPEGLVDSIRNLRRAGIVPIGAGRSQEVADAPAYVRVRGWTIGLVGVGEVLDPLTQVADGNEVGTAVGHDFPRALRAIRQAAAKADLVVVMLHWGVELDTQPRAYQVDQAHQMIHAGADVIFGSHSHRLQPMDTYEGRPIFYGLGNFVWPSLSVDGSTTAVAEVIVRPDGTITGRLLPAYIASDGHPVLR